MNLANAETLTSTLPARLDRLPWSRWHWRVVIALGITWILDGIEVTMVGSLGPTLQQDGTLGLSAAEIGWAGSAYVAGAVLGALFFGRLADKLGRKPLFLATLSVYLVATLLTAATWDFWSFAFCRVLTGFGIGGEYAAINSAIDELIPARVRGLVDLAINGSFWLGAAAGAGLSIVLLEPGRLAEDVGWRVAFAFGAVLTVAILLVRRHLPESPRWLMTRGRLAEAEAVVARIEAEVEREHGPCTECRNAFAIRRRPEPRVGGARSVELEGGRVLVAERAAGAPDQLPGPRDLVGRVEPPPQLGGAPQRGERGARVARLEIDQTARVRRQRRERAAVAACGDRLELPAGGPRRLVLADRQHDLDAGGQQARARRGSRGLGRGPADRGRRGSGPALGETQQGETRLRLPAMAARRAVGLLGGGELAPQAVDLALAIERLAGRPRVVRSRAALAGPPRLRQRVRPGPAQLHDPGAVDQTAAGERQQVGLPFAPARQGGGPFPGAAHLVSVLAGEDHAAVDDARDDRIELAGGDRHHRLVQQPQAPLEVPVPDQDPALIARGEREQVRVAEAPSDRRRLAGGGGRRLAVAGGNLLVDDREQQVAAFDAVALLLVEQPAGAPDPPARPARLPAGASEAEPDPERTAHGSQRVPGIEVGAVCALQPTEVVGLATDHVGRVGEPLQVRGFQRVGTIGGRQGLVGGAPRLAFVGLAPSLELSHTTMIADPRQAFRSMDLTHCVRWRR